MPELRVGRKASFIRENLITRQLSNPDIVYPIFYQPINSINSESTNHYSRNPTTHCNHNRNPRIQDCSVAQSTSNTTTGLSTSWGNDIELTRTRNKIKHLIQLKLEKRDLPNKINVEHPNKKQKTTWGSQSCELAFKIGCFNLHGLKEREEFASDLAADLNALFFCESMMKNLIETNSHFMVDNKRIYFRNAVQNPEGGRPTGGIGFVVDDSIECEVNLKLNDWMGTLTIGNTRIIGVYMQYEKDNNTELIFVDQLATIQMEIDKCKAEYLEPLIIGDFNVDLRRASKHKEILNSFIRENDLKPDDYLNEQSIQFNPFQNANGKSWVDHCLSYTRNNQVQTCKIYVDKQNHSDHHPLVINYKLKCKESESVYKEYELKKSIKIDYFNEDFVKECGERLNKSLSTCEILMTQLEKLNADKQTKLDYLSSLYSNLSNSIVSSNVKSHNFVTNQPEMRKRSRRKRKLQKWWDDEMRFLYLRKCDAYKLYANTDFKGTNERETFNQCKRDFRDKKRYKKKVKRDMLFRYVDKLFHLDREDFWKQIRRMEKQCHTVNIKVEKLKDEYEKIFNESNCSAEEVKSAQEEVDTFLRDKSTLVTNYKLDESVLQGMIGELRNGKSVGLRGISNEMVKYCPYSKLTPLIAKLYSYMINEKIQPASFNISIIKPIIKSEKKPNDDINNTRPVAISDCLQNLFEKVLLYEINKGHQDHKQQFGFKTNSSCSHAVFVVTQAANFAKQNGQRMYTCAVDASKAFDKVSRPHLWIKLMRLKIQTSFVIAIIVYYNSSFMIVQLNEKFSELFRTTMGVRQGGVLSPKLFSIFVEDLLRELEMACLGIKDGK